jgi:hypothetical protein
LRQLRRVDEIVLVGIERIGIEQPAPATEDDSWQQKYKPRSLRAKRLALYESMAGFTRA